MGKRKRLILWAVVAKLALLVVIGLVVLARRPWRQVMAYPDGRVHVFAGTTYRDHRIDVGEWWQKLLPTSPGQRAAYPASLSPAEVNGRDPLVFWFADDPAAFRRYQRGLTRAGMFASVGQQPWPWVTALDEQGDAIGPQHRGTLRGFGGRSGVLAVVLEAFPRRGQLVRLRFHRRNSPLPFAEFTAPNPDPGPHPVWTPEPYPIRRTAGHVECALVEAVAGLGRRGRPLEPGLPAFTRLTFRFSRAGKPDEEWEPLNATFSDATGNRCTPWEGDFERRGTDCVLHVPATLSPREAAWKLKVELARNARARFAPEQTWTVRGVRVPARRGVTPVGVQGAIGAVRLSLNEVTGPDQAWFKPRVRVKMAGPLAGRRLTLTARDDRGRTFAGFGTTNAGRQQLEGERCDFFLNLPPDSRTLDLTFALQQSRYLEFLAKPLLP